MTSSSSATLVPRAPAIQHSQFATAIDPPDGESGGEETEPDEVEAPAKLLVRVVPVHDRSRQLAPDCTARLAAKLERSIERGGVATARDRGLPTAAELAARGAHAFVVSSVVHEIAVTRSSSGATIACTVQMNIAPWHGTDGGERWEANRTATARASAKATTGRGAREVETGMRACVESASEDLATRQVLPFVRRAAAN